MAILSAVRWKRGSNNGPGGKWMPLIERLPAIYETLQRLQCCSAIDCALHAYFMRDASHCDDEAVGEPLGRD
jgi:hypothetical protein